MTVLCAVPSAAVSFLTFFGQGAGILIGWYVVHRLAATRDRDKARREMVAKSADALSNDAKHILLNARLYHLDTRNVDKEIEIKMDLQDMGLRASVMSQISNDDVALAECRTSIAALRRAVTGNHFEDEHLLPLVQSDQQLQLIAEEALRVQTSFLKLKHLQFPSS